MNAEAPKIDTQAAFGAALLWGFETAIARGVRQISCVDADFAVWPLSDTALLQGLAGWLRQPQRRLVLLAAGYDAMPRRHARFGAWRRDWAHAIQAWQAPLELAADLPTVLLADTVLSVELLDGVHWRGVASQDARAARVLRERVDGVLQRSEPAYKVYTLGL
jgi:hypothetical protein